MMLEDFLDSLGHRVAGIADNVEEALAKVEEGGFDVAIIDVHLKGEHVWPVADRLVANGVPYILATGGHISPPPPEHADAIVLAKPFSVQKLAEAARDALEAK